ncbi:MAG: bifunctional DNA primase/polymerase [Sedimentisphaerales bacterium]
MGQNKKKKPFKPFTKDNIYKFKKLTLRNFNRFISPFIDKYNWGSVTPDGTKSFHYSEDWIYKTPYKSYIKLKEKPRPGKYRDISLQDHLDGRNNPDLFVFYTSNPYSDLCLLCGDLDPIPGYNFDDCLKALHYIKNTFFPDIYWEQSTTGRGIHFYIIIDFSSFVPHCGNLYNTFHRNNCNHIIELYSELLSSVVNSMFFCKFDRFCGTYPVYSYPLSNHIFKERGCLGKLPCPQSNGDSIVLVNTLVLSYEDLGRCWDYMQELLIGSNSSNNPDKTCKSTSSPLLPLNILGRDFSYITKNDEKLEHHSAWERTVNSIMKLSREIGRIPSYEEWNEYYIKNNCNTGEETEKRINRFKSAVKTVEKTFDPAKIGNIYKYGDFLDCLLKDITQEEINRIVKEHTNYRYKITHQDLDIGLGAHWMSVRTHMQYGKQLSVPRNTIPSLFKALTKKRIIKRSCDLSKAKAIRFVLQHIKYIKLIDPYYSFKKGDHISQRWGMDEKFPKYNDYQLFCRDAEEIALDIKKMRDEGKGELVKSNKFLPQVYQEILKFRAVN